MRPFAIVALLLFQSQPPTPTPHKAAHVKQPKTQSEQTKPSSQDESAKQLIAAINQLSAKIAAQDKQSTTAEQNDKSSSDRWLKINSGLVTLFTLALAILAYRQWRAMHRQAEYMLHGLKVSIRAARASKRSADAAKVSADSIKNIERPWILLHHIDRWAVTQKGSQQLQIAVRWTVKNFGRTPALVQKIEGNVAIVPASYEFPDEPSYQKPLSTLYETPIIPPGGESFEIMSAMDRGWEAGELNRVSNGNPWFIFSGHVIYEDPFGGKHESRFCLRAKEGSTTPNTPIGPRRYNEHT